jgi:hypothetical protein
MLKPARGLIVAPAFWNSIAAMLRRSTESSTVENSKADARSPFARNHAYNERIPAVEGEAPPRPSGRPF